ncbi:MAG: hypothetical protein IJ196_08730 [Prevotella sp.]|nr:hypothetical protein [Prevotella sp.]
MKQKLFIIAVLTAILPAVAQAQSFTMQQKDSLGIYFVPDQLPQYPGGNEAMQQDIMKQLGQLDLGEMHRLGLSMTLTLSMVIDEKGRAGSFAPHWMLVRPARETLPSTEEIGEEAARDVLTKERLDGFQSVIYEASTKTFGSHMKRWKPARHKGKKVKCHYTIPLRF